MPTHAKKTTRSIDVSDDGLMAIDYTSYRIADPISLKALGRNADGEKFVVLDVTARDGTQRDVVFRAARLAGSVAKLIRFAAEKGDWDPPPFDYHKLVVDWLAGSHCTKRVSIGRVDGAWRVIDRVKATKQAKAAKGMSDGELRKDFGNRLRKVAFRKRRDFQDDPDAEGLRVKRDGERRYYLRSTVVKEWYDKKTRGRAIAIGRDRGWIAQGCQSDSNTHQCTIDGATMNFYLINREKLNRRRWLESPWHFKQLRATRFPRMRFGFRSRRQSRRPSARRNVNKDR